MIRRPPRSTRTDTLFPYTTLFRSGWRRDAVRAHRSTSGDQDLNRQQAQSVHYPLKWVVLALRERAEAHHNQRCRRTLDLRSEEHTSELQSLMRNSYAVFCLKKKKKNNDTLNNKTQDNTDDNN